MVLLFAPNMEAEEDILDVCFGEGLFTKPLRHSKRTKEKEIPTRNPHKYTKTLCPIYENQKLDRKDLVDLPYHTTYYIKTREHDVKEEDILYHIFAVESGGSKNTSTFMRTWLHLFVCMQRKYFTTLAMTYFNSKGLTLDTWMEGILGRRKGHVLVLHGLCLLTERHAWIHLSKEGVWTSLHDKYKSH